MEHLHLPGHIMPGQPTATLIGHRISADCPCKPERRTITKRRSDRQGYITVRIEFTHHALPEKIQEA